MSDDFQGWLDWLDAIRHDDECMARWKLTPVISDRSPWTFVVSFDRSNPQTSYCRHGIYVGQDQGPRGDPSLVRHKLAEV